jgi:hypothetical protein
MWRRLDAAARSSLVKARWGRMLPGHKDQFLERVSEALRARYQDSTLEEKRMMTAAARSKRWEGHRPIRLLSGQERRQLKREYQRRYRNLKIK